MEPPDITQYQHYWMTEEEIPELDLRRTWTRQSMLQHVKEQLAEYPPLLSRHFQHFSKEPDTKKSTSTIKVMQWNVLAQALGTGKDIFLNCPFEALNWTSRKLRMVEEILTVDADVVCLQEVDRFPFLKAILQPLGYEGVFFPKPDSPCLYIQGTTGPDGCAIFYKKEAVNVINTDSVVLQTFERNHFTNQVCLILTMEINDGSAEKKTIAVGTTHLKAKPHWHKLRHSQGRYLLDYLMKNYANIPLVITGDFNADPKEPVYEAFSTSPLNFDSAYKQFSTKNSEPPFTSWKIRGTTSGPIEVCKTVDYIWYTPLNMTVQSLWKLPSEDELAIDLLPSFSYASDHLALAAEFAVASV